MDRTRKRFHDSLNWKLLFEVFTSMKYVLCGLFVICPWNTWFWQFTSIYRPDQKFLHVASISCYWCRVRTLRYLVFMDNVLNLLQTCSPLNDWHLFLCDLWLNCLECRALWHTMSCGHDKVTNCHLEGHRRQKYRQLWLPRRVKGGHCASTRD